MRKLYDKYGEILRYLIIGGLTTLVSIGSYSILIKLFPIHYLINNFISWVITIIFAFIMNKIFVFKSMGKTKRGISIELYKFIKYRLLSLIIDMMIMYLLVSIINVDELISKVIVQFIIVIINYIFSKFFVFKKN